MGDTVVKRNRSVEWRRNEKFQTATVFKNTRKEMMVVCLKRKFRRETTVLMDDKIMINCLAWEFCD